MGEARLVNEVHSLLILERIPAPQWLLEALYSLKIVEIGIKIVPSRENSFGLRVGSHVQPSLTLGDLRHYDTIKGFVMSGSDISALSYLYRWVIQKVCFWLCKWEMAVEQDRYSWNMKWQFYFAITVNYLGHVHPKKKKKTSDGAFDAIMIIITEVGFGSHI